MAVPKDQYLLVVEDDPEQAEAIANALRRRCRNHDVLVVETESEFRRRLAEISEHPPDVAIIDVILRWSDPDPPIPKRPAGVDEGGIQKAGLRCEQLLVLNPATAQVPVIFYTVTHANYFADDLRAANALRRESDLPEFDFLVKEPELDTLTEAVRKRLHSARSD